MKQIMIDLISNILFIPNITLAERSDWSYSNSWISPDEIIPVVIKSDYYVLESYLNSVTNSIYSDKIQIKNSENYCFGWNNAIQGYNEKFNQKIPKLELIERTDNERYIFIKLTSDPNTVLDGHVKRYFKNELISHAEIKIYNLEQLKEKQL